MIELAPNAQAIYISRKNPTTRESSIAVTNRTVAENAVWTRAGSSNWMKRRVMDLVSGVTGLVEIWSLESFGADGIMADSTRETTSTCLLRHGTLGSGQV